MTNDGSYDVWHASETLAARLPAPLSGLARLAYNLRWTWTGGETLFSQVSPHLWGLAGGSAVRFLSEISVPALLRAAQDEELVASVEAAVEKLDAYLASGPPAERGPIAYFCAEFGLHYSLPFYSGGLGVLAGDVLKEASDDGVRMVGVGLLYRQGYFRQRLDISGWQNEWWSDAVPERLPMALVREPSGHPVVIAVPLRGRAVHAQIWRVDVGRVALYLLDCERSDNSRVDRWITSRLYVADRRTRLTQYALLGRGGILALQALGIDPAVVHLNEGHAAFAPLELAAVLADRGRAPEKALESARRRTVFTTHTPVAAGNETIDPIAVAELVADLPARLGTDMRRIIGLARVTPDDPNEPFGLTPLGIRMSRAVNAVSRRHGYVAREMWRGLYPNLATADVPIVHVTNGIHLPTWVAHPLQRLFDHHLGRDWRERSHDPALWENLSRISDEELWQARCRLRRELVDYVRDRSVANRLSRGEAVDYIEAAARTFDPSALTIGFARRLATYKRLELLLRFPERAVALLGDEDRPVQLVLAGKAHPMDDAGKAVVRELFRLRREHGIGGHVVFLEDYELSVAQRLVAGCDVWVNLPRFPLEASGTSGMKAGVNGALNLSISDGWWEEVGEHRRNGWVIGGASRAGDPDVDQKDAQDFFDILENEVVPLFYATDASGIPRAWIERVRHGIATIGQRCSAARMLDDYIRLIWGEAFRPRSEPRLAVAEAEPESAPSPAP